jgi:hypothetical protein
MRTPPERGVASLRSVGTRRTSNPVFARRCTLSGTELAILSSRRTEHAMEVASIRVGLVLGGGGCRVVWGVHTITLLHAIDDALTKAQSLMLVLP